MKSISILYNYDEGFLLECMIGYLTFLHGFTCRWTRVHVYLYLQALRLDTCNVAVFVHAKFQWAASILVDIHLYFVLSATSDYQILK